MDTFDYFDHDADIGIIGRGRSVEAAFVSAAEAVFAVMGCTPSLPCEVRVDIVFEEEDRELALVQWLNLLLSEASSRQLLFCRFRLERRDAQWEGTAWGCPIGSVGARGTEVKGATLTMLSVTEGASGWEARCVVDV